MSSVMMSALCNKCDTKYPEYWVSRDHKGYPSLENAICEHCGAKNCMSRDWTAQQVQAIIPPLEDGNINRFEYEITTEDGKKVNRKMDPKHVQKHFENNYKGQK